MKEKFPNLKWVVVMRHAAYDMSDDLPKLKSKDFIIDKLGPAILRKIPIGNSGKEVMITSQILRGVVTGNYISYALGIDMSIGIGSLSGDRYNEGRRMIDCLLEHLPEQTELLIIVGHFEGVPGIANAITEDSFGKTVECFEPSYLEGVVINMETSEHRVGIKEFFEV